MKRHLRRWGVVYILALFLVGSWIGQFATTAARTAKDARAHGEAFAWNDVWTDFWSATLENWQSEWLSLLMQAVLLLGMRHQLFRASSEDQERMEAKIDQLLRERGLDPAAGPGPRPAK